VPANDLPAVRGHTGAFVGPGKKSAHRKVAYWPLKWPSPSALSTSNATQWP
jgi:hypothetical protein